MTHALSDLLHRERSHVDAFIDMLHAEAEILGDPAALEALSALTERKEALARELAVIGEQRDQLLRQDGLAAGFDGMEAACRTDPALSAAWAAVLEAARTASALNRQNGALIDAHLSHTQASIQGLRQLQAGNTAVYDAYGKTRNAGVRRAIAAG